MPNAKNGSPKAARKSPVSRRTTHRVKRDSQAWFFHPEVQAGIAEAEADFLNGRAYHTDSADALQRLLDNWK